MPASPLLVKHFFCHLLRFSYLFCQKSILGFLSPVFSLPLSLTPLPPAPHCAPVWSDECAYFIDLSSAE